MKILSGIFLLTFSLILLLTACAQQQTKYACPDGSLVSDVSLCKKTECKVYSDGTCTDLTGKHELNQEEFSFCKDNSVYEMNFKCTNNACEKVMHELKKCDELSVPPSVIYECGYAENEARTGWYKKYATCKLKTMLP